MVIKLVESININSLGIDGRISGYGVQNKTKHGLLLLYVEAPRGSPKVTVGDCSKYS